MQRYEYWVMECGSCEAILKAKEALNEAGLKGWRLSQAIPNEDSDFGTVGAFLILERPLPN